MARGRFISATLGGSRKFARLANDTHRMIYMLLIPNTDAYGRVDADPVTLGGRVLTRLGISPDAVSAALADMHTVGLIHLYAVGDDQFAEIVNFHEHNDIDLSREAQAEIPDARGVMPPAKPPRGTKRADADPRVWSGDYLAANVHPQAEQDRPKEANNTPAPPPSRPAPDNGNQAPHAANQRQSNPNAIRLEVEGEVEVEEEPTPLPPKGGSGGKPPRNSRGRKRKPKQHEFNPLDPELDLPDNFDRELFADFCARLLEIGKPMTILALRHFVDAHRHHDQTTLDEMFRRSIRAGWPDLYPIDRSHSGSGPAAKAWEEILESARRGKPPENLDALAKAALQAVDGWSSVAFCPNHLLGQKRAKFLDAYDSSKRGKAA